MFSLRPYLEVLAKLQDNILPRFFLRFQETIEKEIGKIDQVFDKFDKKAKSGASLGQVYLASYKGRDVIIKASRPHIEKTVSRDTSYKVNPSFSNPLSQSNLRYYFEAIF